MVIIINIYNNYNQRYCSYYSEKASADGIKSDTTRTSLLKIYHFFAENEFFWLLLRTIYV